MPHLPSSVTTLTRLERYEPSDLAVAPQVDAEA